jgi:Dolichyl-phosphate-mannose-protein mannosyltransferase
MPPARTSPARVSRAARSAARVLGRRRVPLRRLLLPALAVALLAVIVRLAYLGDAAPTLYTWRQHGVRMALHYTEAATGILAGDGVLYPRVWPDPSETRLVSRPPGYPAFVAAVHGTLGSNYGDVLAAQALLTALLPAALLVLVTRVAGRRAGLAAGVLAALSPPLGYHASIVTPDALTALLAVLAILFFWRARETGGRAAAAWLAAAGATVGTATWLRPNFLFLGLALALAAPFVLARQGSVWPKAAGMVAVACAVVVPITIRNARIYGELVPVSANGGIVLWEGIADAGGRKFGARSLDLEVAAEEAGYFGDPRYARGWATPDGIRRDRARVRRSLEVIRAHPVWWGASVARRAGDVLVSGREAPLVQPRPPELAADSTVLDHPAVKVDAALGPARPVVRALQRVAAWPAEALAAVGLAFLALVAPRRALLLVLVPAYVLLVQSPMHFEARFALPMAAFTPALEAVGFLALAGAAARRAVRGASSR